MVRFYEWQVNNALEPYVRADGLVIVDSEGDRIAEATTPEQATVIAELLNWAVDHYPYRPLDDE